MKSVFLDIVGMTVFNNATLKKTKEPFNLVKIISDSETTKINEYLRLVINGEEGFP